MRADLENDMNMYAKELKFEDAQKVKEMIWSLDHVRDAHLITRDVKPEDMGIRIEAFDVAHLSGTNRVGAMTVVLGGVLAKHEYKKFKISIDKNDDLQGLLELFTRRIKHFDWGTPDIVVVDGDERHLNLVEGIIKELIQKMPEKEFEPKKMKPDVKKIVESIEKEYEIIFIINCEGKKEKKLVVNDLLLQN